MRAESIPSVSPRAHRSKFLRVLPCAFALAVLLGACGSDAETVAGGDAATTGDVAETVVASDTTAAPETVANAETTTADSSSDTTADTTADTTTDTAEDTGSSDSDAVVSSLPADSATCSSLQKIKEYNDQSGELTSKFQAKILEAISAENPDALETEWDSFRADFTKDAETVLPGMQDAYATLAKEQPQFADEFENLSFVTEKLLAVFGDLSFDDLENMEAKMAEAVPQEKIIAAGMASLEIDKFSKAACDIPFANT